MTILSVVEIIRLTLEIINKLPPEALAAAWERHEARMAFFEKLIDRVTPDESKE